MLVFPICCPSHLITFSTFVHLVRCLSSHSFVCFPFPTMIFHSALSTCRDKSEYVVRGRSHPSLSLFGQSRLDSNINWKRNLSSTLHLPHLLMPTFDLVVVGSGGGPFETNLSSFVSSFSSSRERCTSVSNRSFPIATHPRIGTYLSHVTHPGKMV